jgi:cell division GTPase FtsZ
MKGCYKPKTSDEIQKASEEYILKSHIDNASVQDHFIAGAEWMRERMIEKVSKWLRKNIDEDVSIPCGNVIKIISADEFVEYFTKSMEEEK